MSGFPWSDVPPGADNSPALGDRTDYVVCTGCGHPMHIDDDECLYCEAKVNEQEEGLYEDVNKQSETHKNGGVAASGLPHKEEVENEN